MFSQKEVSTDTILPVHLEEVMVTATRTIRQLSAVPLPVQLISKKEIKRVNALRLTDILNEFTGLITVSDFGGGEGIQMQGLDAQHTLILIDGMPLVGRLAGTLDLNRLSIGNLTQAEVVKGASSSLYGSEALGGVINLISEQPKTGLHGDFSYRYATFNSQDAQATMNFGSKKIKVNSFFNRYSSDGYSLNNTSTVPTVSPFENYTLSSKIHFDISKSSNLMISGRYFTQDQDYQAQGELEGETSADEWNLTGKYSYEFSKSWEAIAELYLTQYQANEYLNETNGESFSSDFYDHRLIRPEIRASWTPKKGQSLIIGMGINNESLNRSNFSTNPETNAPYIYAQFDGKINDAFSIILGSRFDAHSEYASQFSPKIALQYRLNDQFALKGSLGYGFKAPDFRQLYFDFSNATVGYTILGYNAVEGALSRMQNLGQISNVLVSLDEFNIGLKPENSLGINVGSTFRLNNNFKTSINFFRNNINDLIDTKIIANKTNGQNVFSYTNINKVYTQGIELDGSWSLDKKFKISAGYQLLYAKDKTAINAFENGEIFARLTASSPSFVLDKNDYFGLFNRSRHMANLKLYYDIPDWNLDANIRTTFRSKYGIIDANGNGHLDRYDPFVKSYLITDIALNKTLYEHYRFSVGVDNLFNFKDPQNISNIAGSLFYTKLNIQF